MHWLYTALLAIIWGGSFFAIKLAVSVFPPFFAAALRLGIALIPTVVLLLARRKKMPSKREWRIGAWLGFIGMAIPWMLLFWGQKYISGALGAILNSTVPLFVILYSMTVLRDKRETTAMKICGVLCGICGVTIIFGPELLANGSAAAGTVGHTHLLGMLAVMGMSAAYGAHIVLLKRYSGGIHPLISQLTQMSVACGVLILFGLTFEGHRMAEAVSLFGTDSAEMSKALLGLLYLGCFATFVGLNLFFRLIEIVGSVRAGAVTFLVPVVAIAVDWLYYGKLASSQQLFGAIFIFGGLALVQFEHLRAKRRAKRALATPPVKEVAA